MKLIITITLLLLSITDVKSQQFSQVLGWVGSYSQIEIEAPKQQEETVLITLGHQTSPGTIRENIISLIHKNTERECHLTIGTIRVQSMSVAEGDIIRVERVSSDDMLLKYKKKGTSKFIIKYNLDGILTDRFGLTWNVNQITNGPKQRLVKVTTEIK